MITTDIRHLSFCQLLKNDDNPQPLKHRLAFSTSHTVTCFLLLFLGETSCLVITEMSGEKNHFLPERQKLNILGGKTPLEIFKNIKSDSLLDDTMIRRVILVSSGSFGYSDRKGCSPNVSSILSGLYVQNKDTDKSYWF